MWTGGGPPQEGDPGLQPALSRLYSGGHGRHVQLERQHTQFNVLQDLQAVYGKLIFMLLVVTFTNLLLVHNFEIVIYSELLCVMYDTGKCVFRLFSFQHFSLNILADFTITAA